MWRKCICLGLVIVCLLSGCSSSGIQQKQYSASFLDLFDTITTIIGYAESEEEFQKKIQPVHDMLLEYHQLFDIYHEYEGMQNLKTVNDQAGTAPVKVDERIMRLLLDCREYSKLTGQKVNAAMGSVLVLWHETRSEGRNDPVNAELPDEEELAEAKKHSSFDSVILDEEASTVYFTDPDVRLDVGAVAKGWSAQRAAEAAPEGLLISLGGNVCATGPKTGTGAPWVVGIQDPDGGAEDYLHTLNISDGCVVTSGDYQRAYVVDGKVYHHIIDPDTLYPAQYWRSVTIVCDDSGAADMLSTALFLMPQEEGQKLLDLFGAKAMWVGPDNKINYSPGFKELIRT